MRMSSAAVLEAIVAHIGEHGYPPSVRELGERVGLRSPSTVHHHLLALRDLDLLAVEPGKSRAMRVTDKGRALLARRGVVV